MKTKTQKYFLIEQAINKIIEVGEDIEESDAFYFINSENSVVSKLRELQYKIEATEQIYKLIFAPLPATVWGFGGEKILLI